MAINLSNLNNRSQQLDQARSAQQKGKVAENGTTAQSAQPAQTNVAQGDSVNITSQAKSLTAMERNLAQGTPVNDAKVERLKKAVEEGNYQVDAQNLAKNMASFESLLA